MTSPMTHATRIPWPPLLPRRMGVGDVIVPLVVGALAGGGLTLPVVLTFVAAFFAFWRANRWSCWHGHMGSGSACLLAQDSGW